MTDERAMAINRWLVAAWMLRDGFSDEPLPDVRNFDAAEAVAACEAMARRRLGQRRNADGSMTLTVHVAPANVPGLMRWIEFQRASDRLDRRMPA